MIGHAMLNVNHYRVDNDAVLNSVGVSGGAAWLHTNKRVTMASLSIRELTYHRDDDRTGTLINAKGSHWFTFGKVAAE